MTGARRFLCLVLLFAPAALAAAPFEFHSDFWLNLHHFLYEQALHPAHAALSGEERAAWDKALSFYRRSMVTHDLLTDLRMRAIDTELAEDETLAKLVVNGSEAELWDTLNSVAAIYRSHWWTAHDQANKAFIAAVIPLVQRHAATLMSQLSTIYEAPWPKDPIRVDVSEYANWAGAYTYTYGWSRVHEIVSSADPANQGDAALEILFHEATHGFVPADSGRLAEQIALLHQPKELVHVFIFYTAGELTRRALGNNYVPYADKKRLYQDKWALWHRGIEVYWKQHMDGSLSLNDAVSKIVRRISN